jgi:hypothetical protein
MKKPIGNLLLLTGVIVSSLAAGESQRVSRVVPVDDELVGKVLHSSVKSNFEATDPGTLVLEDRTLEAGRTLDAEDVNWLRACDLDEVLILRRAKDTEIVALDEALGRSLATSLVLEEEFEEIPAGRLLTPNFVGRLEHSALTEVIINAAGTDADGKTTRKEIAWSFAEGAQNPEGVKLVGSDLREKITLPVQLRPASYVDEKVLERMRASGIDELSVKIPRSWTWNDWGSRWIFVIGIGITLLGVLLKRSGPGAHELEAGAMEVARIGELLTDLEGSVERLGGRADALDAEAIHREVDPLLIGPVYAIANGRESIRGAHGGRVFAAVMDAFARGERKLNRAWSAAVDGHAPEARKSLVSALPALREAREALPGTHPPGPSGFDAADEGTPLPPDVPLTGGEDPWTQES